jgi:hypothetical protein
MASTRPSTNALPTGKKTGAPATSSSSSASTGKPVVGVKGPSPHSNLPPAKSSPAALAYIQSRTTDSVGSPGGSGGSGGEEGPMERYFRLNMLLLKKLQSSEWAEAEILCTELDRLVPNHPNVLAFRLLLAEKNNGPSSPAPPAATVGTSPAQLDHADDDESDGDLFQGGEEGSSQDEDEGSDSDEEDDDGNAYDHKRRAMNVSLSTQGGQPTPALGPTTGSASAGKRPSPITPSQSNVRQTPTTGAQKASPSGIGTPEDITDDEIDRMFAGTAQEAAEIMKRFGILSNPGQAQAQVPRR